MFMPDLAYYTSNLDLKIQNNALHMATHPNVLGLNLDSKTINPLFLTTAATQQTFPHIFTTTDIKTNIHHIRTLSLGI